MAEQNINQQFRVGNTDETRNYFIKEKKTKIDFDE